jgi:hypothetical protein
MYFVVSIRRKVLLNIHEGDLQHTGIRLNNDSWNSAVVNGSLVQVYFFTIFFIFVTKFVLKNRRTSSEDKDNFWCSWDVGDRF